MTFTDFIIIPLVVLFAHGFVKRTANRFPLGQDKQLLTSLFYYHLLFSLLFALYVTIYGGDSVSYWQAPTRFFRADEGWLSLHAPGTSFVFFLTYPFSQLLNISFVGGTVMFSLFGFLGIVYLYLTARRTLRLNPRVLGFKLFPLILFLPNMHFWSGGVGKDSVIFFALCLFVFCLTNIKTNIPGLLISLYFAFFVRPHIALVMIVALSIALMLSAQGLSFFWRTFFLAASVVTLVLISSTVFEFIGLEEENIESYDDIANIRSKNLARSGVGSRIDISDYSVPMKMFTFFFRPLFFDAGNVFGLFVSFENLFYVILLIYAIRARTLALVIRMSVALKTCLVASIAIAFFMSSSLSNLGIIVRQKNMAMFMLLLVIMYLIAELQYGAARKGNRS